MVALATSWTVNKTPCRSELMGKRVVLASANSGKLKELAALLGEFSIELVAQAHYHIESVEETGLSFVENAIIKARHASRLTGMPAIADDSGLCVDALKGGPGIYSARYAGADASDEDNIVELLSAMKNVPDSERAASFECVIVFLEYPEDPTPIICHGRWSGRVLRETRGENGFGYDPLFFAPETGCSCAELDPETKNRLSHRAKATRQLVEQLRENLGTSG